MQARKRCSHPGCRELLDVRDTYCNGHSKTVNREYNQYRSEAHAEYIAFYKIREWRRMRTTIMRRDQHLCRMCLDEDVYTPADLVDHIVPSKVDWSRRLDPDNLQSLCTPCHNMKSAEDTRQYPVLGRQ